MIRPCSKPFCIEDYNCLTAIFNNFTWNMRSCTRTCMFSSKWSVLLICSVHVANIKIYNTYSIFRFKRPIWAVSFWYNKTVDWVKLKDMKVTNDNSGNGFRNFWKGGICVINALGLFLIPLCTYLVSLMWVLKIEINIAYIAFWLNRKYMFIKANKETKKRIQRDSRYGGAWYTIDLLCCYRALKILFCKIISLTLYVYVKIHKKWKVSYVSKSQNGRFRFDTTRQLI